MLLFLYYYYCYYFYYYYYYYDYNIFGSAWGFSTFQQDLARSPCYGLEVPLFLDNLRNPNKGAADPCSRSAETMSKN